MKKRNILGLTLGIVMTLGSCSGKNEKKPVDIVAGASQIPLENTMYLTKSKSVGRYFLRISGEDKFIGYNAKYDIDKNSYYQLRVTGAGPDGRWFTDDDQINKYYKITLDEYGNQVSAFQYSENSKKGIAYFGKNDKVSKGTNVVEFSDKHQPIKADIYKKDKVVGYIKYVYNTDNKLVKEESYDLNDKLGETSGFTYKIEDGKTIRRETEYNKDGSVDKYKDSYIVDGKVEKLVKKDAQERVTATETYDSIRRNF